MFVFMKRIIAFLKMKQHPLLLVFCSLFFLSCQSFSVNEHLLESSEIPESFDGFVMVFLSDLHINSFRDDSYFKKLVTQVEALNPDLILLGGDYIDGHTEDILLSLEHLGPLNRFPVYYVMGNHDNWENRSLVIEGMDNMGFKLLDNRQQVFQQEEGQIILAGLADLYTDRLEIEHSLEGVEEEDFCILLSHSPEPYALLRNDPRVDLMLSGHTHGGQVTFFGLWAPVLPLYDKTYWRGTYTSELNQLIISNGIGYSKMGIRVFARPGIEWIILESLE